MSNRRSWLSYLAWHLTIKPRLKRIQREFPGAKVYPTGSRYVCDPPHFDTDVDFLVYSSCAGTPITPKLTFFETLTALPYRKTTLHYQDNREFQAYRRGVVNLIVTSDARFAERFIAATHYCKQYNLHNKMDRILIHEAFRFNAKDNKQIYNLDCAPSIIREFVTKMTGPYGNAFYQIYKATHDIKGPEDDL